MSSKVPGLIKAIKLGRLRDLPGVEGFDKKEALAELKSSELFYVPQLQDMIKSIGVKAINEMYEELDGYGLIHLPADPMILEYRHDHIENHFSRMVMENEGQSAHVAAFADEFRKMKDKQRWFLLCKENPAKGVRLCEFLSFFRMNNKYSFMGKNLDHYEGLMISDAIADCSFDLKAFLVIMCMKGTQRQRESFPHSQLKAPLTEDGYTRVYVDLHKEECGLGKSLAGSRRSPRIHYRVGHPRRVRTRLGIEWRYIRPVWVNAHLEGAGQIHHKEYVVIDKDLPIEGGEEDAKGESDIDGETRE